MPSFVKRHPVFTQPHFFSFEKKSGAGFTLIELLISIAIIGILTAIVFSSLRDEQQRSAAKDATDRLQIELLGLQNKVQSAVTTTLKYCTRLGGNYDGQGNPCGGDPECLIGTVQGRCVSGPPAGYGFSINRNGTVYQLFADMPMGTTSANGIRGDLNDQLVATDKPLGTNIIAKYFLVDGKPIGLAGGVDITFSGSNGQMKIYSSLSRCPNQCSSARIVLQNTKTLVCYAITLDKASGIVSKRQHSPSCR